MKTIRKYKIENGLGSIEMPQGAEFLSLQVQNGSPHIWMLVDPHRETERRLFSVMGTGHSMSDENYRVSTYLGGYQLAGGQFVGHLFEVKD